GGETGPGSAPAVAIHVLNLMEQCAAAGVPLFFKQWGGHPKSARGKLISGEPLEQVPAELLAGPESG
ncbi:MAG: phage Gp37/Gp68 family protein, partial [Nitrospinae bacterium]|nr:phage Gp37/Gp68 family protein [Nitrospinota bacterium]